MSTIWNSRFLASSHVPRSPENFFGYAAAVRSAAYRKANWCVMRLIETVSAVRLLVCASALFRQP